MGSNSADDGGGGTSDEMLGSVAELAEYSSASAGKNPADLMLGSTGDASAVSPLTRQEPDATPDSSAAAHTKGSTPGGASRSSTSSGASKGAAHSHGDPGVGSGTSGPKSRSLAQGGLLESSHECQWVGSAQEEAEPGWMTAESNHTACRFENLVLFNGQVGVLHVFHQTADIPALEARETFHDHPTGSPCPWLKPCQAS